MRQRTLLAIALSSAVWAPSLSAGEPVRAERFMIAAANPHALRAGCEVLEAGGNAVAAMGAVQFVLNLVEPQSSGIRGIDP